MGLCNRAGSAASTGFTAWGRSGSSKLKPRFRLSCALRGAGLRGAERAANYGLARGFYTTKIGRERFSPRFRGVSAKVRLSSLRD